MESSEGRWGLSAGVSAELSSSIVTPGPPCGLSTWAGLGFLMMAAGIQESKGGVHGICVTSHSITSAIYTRLGEAAQKVFPDSREVEIHPIMRWVEVMSGSCKKSRWDGGYCVAIFERYNLTHSITFLLFDLEESCHLESVSGCLFSKSIWLHPLLKAQGQYKAQRKQVKTREGILGPADVNSQRCCEQVTSCKFHSHLALVFLMDKSLGLMLL